MAVSPWCLETLVVARREFQIRLGGPAYNRWFSHVLEMAGDSCHRRSAGFQVPVVI